MARMWLLAWTSGTSHSRLNLPGGVITSIWPLLPLASSTGFGIAFSGILSFQTYGWLQQAMRSAPNAKVRLRSARSLGFLSGPPGSFETCITSFYQRPLASLNVLASHPLLHLPFNILHLFLFSPPPIQRILFQGFFFPRISFLCLSMCTMERKIPPLACLPVCLSAHHASPCIFSSCLTFLFKNFIDFILFLPTGFLLPLCCLLVMCLRMACDVMNMLFLDFF
jgi:hypothetical protein